MNPSATPDPPSQPVTIVALVLLAGCLLSSGRLLWDALRPGHPKDPAEVAQRSDQRFAALKAVLPARGVVGYIGESSALARGDYYLAEYALSPLVVDDSTNHRLVIGNFPSSGSVPSSVKNLQLVKDFGNGVLLLANKDAS